MTMTHAAEKLVPRYASRPIAKAWWQRRYLAFELGKKNIRVNAISADPIS